MLSINPKQRPTILDVLNKSVVRKHVLGYMIEIFSGNFPESNDIDDVFKQNNTRYTLIVLKNKHRN